MQALKYILKPAAILSAIACIAALSGCGEKTPEQIAAEKQKQTEISVRRAKVLMFEEKHSEAAKMLEQTYQECGASPDLCEALAYAYAQGGKPASAAMFFEIASDLKGGDADLQINAAKSYEQSNATDSAVKAYEKYLKLKPTDMVAWKALSECYSKQEKYQEALNALMGALKVAGRNPNTAEATAVGILFVKIGNANQGRRWLEAAYKATLPENTATRKEILANLAIVYLAEKQTALLEETVASLDKIDPAFIDSKYPNLRAQLKEFRAKLKEAQDLIDAQKEAEAKAKADADAKIKAEADAKAKADADAKAQEQAKTEAEKTAKTEDKTDAPAKEQGDFSPNMEETVVQGNVSDLTAAPAQESKYDSLVKKCYELMEKGDAAGAQKAAHAAIAEDRSPEAAWRALAKAYEMSKKNNDSFMAAREAYIRNPDDINATLFFLRNASRVENNEKFLDSLYRAHEKFPNNPEIWVGLARTYNLIGDRRNAVYFYNLFLTTTPKEHPLYEEMSDEFKSLSESK